MGEIEEFMDKLMTNFVYPKLKNGKYDEVNDFYNNFRKRFIIKCKYHNITLYRMIEILRIIDCTIKPEIMKAKR